MRNVNELRACETAQNIGRLIRQDARDWDACALGNRFQGNTVPLM